MTGSRATGFVIPETMKAWVLGDPDELLFIEKPVPRPGRAEVLVRIDAIAVCALGPVQDVDMGAVDAGGVTLATDSDQAAVGGGRDSP